MFGIGIPELILIALVALVAVGPKKLPITLRAIGQGIRAFRRALLELRREAGFAEVVDEVTRPLREGLAGIETEALRDEPESRTEYPEGGPDDYGALPEHARVYPDGSVPVLTEVEATRLEGTRGSGPQEPGSDG